MLDQAAYLDRDLSDLDELIARGRPGAKRLRAVRRRHTPGSTRTASANEERLLALAGIRVVRITTERLAHEPQAAAGELARLLSRK